MRRSTFRTALTGDRGLFVQTEREGQHLDAGRRVNEDDGKQVRAQTEVEIEVMDAVPQLGAFKST